MTANEAQDLFKFIAVEYVFIGLFLCALTRVDKWKLPYAIPLVLMLWPAWLGSAVIEMFKETFRSEQP